KLGLASTPGGGGTQAAVLAVLALSSVLNALYYIPALIAIWRPAARPARPEKDPAFALGALGLMAGVLALGIFFQPVTALISRGLELM
ncbi:MAG: hypothetical protein NC319_08540, partial [Butyricicoccus sp.]|nr:hypothetical protein [Butyricicoccus sp.]